MHQEEFFHFLARQTNLPKTQVSRVYKIIVASILQNIKTDKSFLIPKIGKFVLVKRNSRKGINLQTGKPILIPAKNVLKFKVSKKLKTELAFFE